MASESSYKYEYFNVTFPVEDVAHVEINRPEKLNAWIETMWHNLSLIFTRLSTDPSCRCVILTGAGPRAFTSGLDVMAAAQSGPLAPSASGGPRDPARTAFGVKTHIDNFQACISSVEKCLKPVIVLLHGVTFGLGIDISVACDVRLATKDVRLCVKEVDIGIAADIGTLTRLPKVVGNYGWVKEVCLSARQFGADEAMRVGFVNRVLENKEEGFKAALEMAQLIASKSPVAVQGTKELLNWSRDRSIEDGLRYTSAWNAGMLQTNDVQESMMGGIQKRKTKFEKL